MGGCVGAGKTWTPEVVTGVGASGNEGDLECVGPGGSEMLWAAVVSHGLDDFVENDSASAAIEVN